MTKIYKTVFTSQIHTVNLALKFSCIVSVTWRRGEKISEVKEKREIEKGIATFNEPLQLECNMNYNTSAKKFQEKKTRFTILIFSEKGNKQAGQVNLDVADFLNAKQKNVKFEKPLQKCPDKSAILTFTLSAYIKQEIQPDAVSQKSANSIAPQSSILTQSLVQQLDFKKKKQQNGDSLSPQPDLKQRPQSQQKILNQQRIPMVNKANKQKLKLQEENRKLKAQLQELKELQIENTTLKRRYEQAEKKALSYYTKKLEQVKKQHSEFKLKAKGVEALTAKKQALEKDMCNYKEQMGRILNFAMTSGNNDMAQKICSIYQTAKT